MAETQEQPTQQLMPRAALEVAIVGNRRFAGEPEHQGTAAAEAYRMGARRACEQVWSVIASAMTSALEMPVRVAATKRERALDLKLADFFSRERPRLAVLTSLAAGADQIGAATALEYGEAQAAVGVEIEAVLPFPEADYPGTGADLRPEFRPAEAEELRRLSGRARQVVRLDSKYSRGGGPVLGYQRARDLVIQNVDLVVAVLDPRAQGRVSGTAETVRRALDAEKPVLMVLLAENEQRIRLYRSPADRTDEPEAEWDSGSALEEERWRTALAELVHYLLALPHQMQSPQEEPDPSGQPSSADVLRETVHRLRVYYGHEPPDVLVRSPRWLSLFGRAWQVALWLGRRRPVPASGLQRPIDDRVTLAPYAHHYTRASQLSGEYMQAYRGMFVTVYLLAAIAVAIAVAGLSIQVYGHGQPRSMLGPLLLALGLGKLAVLWSMMTLERLGAVARHQDVAADARYLAELLRPTQWLAQVGVVSPSVSLPAHYAALDPRQGWTTWLFRAVGRATPTVSVQSEEDGTAREQVGITFCRDLAERVLASARTTWLGGQIRYHEENAQRMMLLEHGYERLGARLLLAVIGAVVLLVAYEALEVFRPAAIEGVEHYLGERMSEWIRLVVCILGGLAAALPAVIASLGGIASQSQAKRLALVSRAMAVGLRRQASLLVLEGGDGGETSIAGDRLRALAGVMISETSHWKALYPLQEVRAG